MTENDKPQNEIAEAEPHVLELQGLAREESRGYCLASLASQAERL